MTRINWHRAFNIGEFVNGLAQQPLPETLKTHESDLGHFTGLCYDLCSKLLRLFAIGLKVCDHMHSDAPGFDMR